MSNPKLVFNKILKDWGTDVLLQRRIYAEGQGLYSLPSATPGVNKNESYYSNKLERWTVRYTFAARKTGLSATLEGRQEGLTTEVPLVFYFQSEAQVREEDRIYMKDPRFDNQMTIWLVAYSEEVQGWHGSPVYHEVGCRRSDEALTI